MTATTAVIKVVGIGGGGVHINRMTGRKRRGHRDQPDAAIPTLNSTSAATPPAGLGAERRSVGVKALGAPGRIGERNRAPGGSRRQLGALTVWSPAVLVRGQARRGNRAQWHRGWGGFAEHHPNDRILLQMGDAAVSLMGLLSVAGAQRRAGGSPLITTGLIASFADVRASCRCRHRTGDISADRSKRPRSPRKPRWRAWAC